MDRSHKRLNRKKWTNQSSSFLTRRKYVNSKISQRRDARKIINFRNKQLTVSNQRAMQSLKRNSFVVERNDTRQQNPDKRVKILPDGNIFITAQSKNKIQQSEVTVQNDSYWEPTEVNIDELEHASINDLIDMEALPSAISTSNFSERHSQQSLVGDVTEMHDTMIADQIAGSLKPHNIKVYVSNLSSTVSRGDIMELFSDVGPIKSITTSPGSAIVEYHNQTDAKNACEIYNNRLLDGQPMHCFVEKSTAFHKAVTQRLGDRFQQSIISSQQNQHFPSTSSNSRLRYNPRDVRFTVKL